MELLGPERAGAIRAGDRGGADEHRLGATLDAPLELLDRLLDDGQRDHRRGVDAALVVEAPGLVDPLVRSEEHTSELQSLMRISYAVFCLTKKNTIDIHKYSSTQISHNNS